MTQNSDGREIDGLPEIRGRSLGDKTPYQKYPCVVAWDGKGIYAIAVDSETVVIYDDHQNRILLTDEKKKAVRRFPDLDFLTNSQEPPFRVPDYPEIIKKYKSLKK